MSRPNKRPHTRSAGIILYYGPKFNTEMGKISDFQALHAIPSPLLQAPGNVEKWAAPQAGARADLPQQCALKKGTGICTGDGGGVCAMSVARRLVCTYHFLRLRAALIAPEPVLGFAPPFSLGCAQRKPRRPVKRKALICRKANATGAGLLVYESCCLEVPTESDSLLPGALYSVI